MDLILFNLVASENHMFTSNSIVIMQALANLNRNTVNIMIALNHETLKKLPSNMVEVWHRARDIISCIKQTTIWTSKYMKDISIR